MKKWNYWIFAYLLLVFLLSGCKSENAGINHKEADKTIEEYQCVFNSEIPLLDMAKESICINEHGYAIAKREDDKTSIIYSTFEGSITEIATFSYDMHVVDIDMSCNKYLAILIKDKFCNYIVLKYDLKGTEICKCQIEVDSDAGEMLSNIEYIDDVIFLTGKNCIYKLNNELKISHCKVSNIGELITICDEDRIALFYDKKGNFGYTILDANSLKEIESVCFKDQKIWRIGKKNIYYQKGETIIRHDRSNNDVELFTPFQFDIGISNIVFFSDCEDGYIFFANANDNSISIIVIANHDASLDFYSDFESNSLSDIEESGDIREEIRFLGVNTSLYQGFFASYNKANNKYMLKVLPAPENWEVYDMKLISEEYDLFEVEDVDYFNYVEKGYLLDISEFIESSENVALKDYFDVVINTFSVDGKIYAIPKEMDMINLFVPKNLLGDKRSWNVDEFLLFMEKYPNCLSRDYHETEENAKCSILNYILYGSIRELIDDGSFHSKEFASILERVNNLNIFITADNEKKRIESGEPLIYKKYIASADDFSKLQSETQCELIIMGFPTLNGGISKGIVCYYDMVGISSNTKNVIGAWNALENYLSRPVAKNHAEVPTRISEFEDKMKEGVDKDPYTIDGVSYVPVSDTDIEKVKSAYLCAYNLSDSDRSIFEIILDSSANYFLGEISLEQAVNNIEKRINILLSEHN